MFLGRVVGTLVASRKEGTLEGLKFLVLRQIDVDRAETGAYVVAADAVGAGTDEVVLIAAGSSARMTEVTKDKPVDAVICGIVDAVEIDGRDAYLKRSEASS